MKIMDTIKQFSPISLEEMDKVKLMNRIDVKFIFNEHILGDVLNKIKEDYHILEVAGVRAANYKTLYFDTKKNKFYLHHHNGKRNRYKVRYREYIDSGNTFFEIKYKNSKGRVIKNRVAVDSIQNELGEEELKLLHKKVGKNTKVEARLENRFKRITLVAKEGIERVTLDFDLQYNYNQQIEGFPDLSIAEVKLERYSRNSKLMETLREFGIRPDRMSKYAIGMSIFSDEKANNFKEKRIKINKIIRDDH